MFAEVNVGHIFSFYGVCMVLQLLWALFLMPETKNISLEEMERRLEIE